MLILKKLFIKDYQNTSDATVRGKYGTLAGIIGIVSNLILFAAKLIIGILGGSITIIADAINNLSDAGSSLLTIIGFKLSMRPADKEHPYGHERYEYITGLVIAFLILLMGVLLGKESVEKIITPQAVTVNVYTYVVLSVAIVAKLWLMLTYRGFGKAIDSSALLAACEDSRNDMISTLTVLIANVIIATTGINLDGYIGVAVSLFILISGIKMLKETINPLLGEVPDKELVVALRKIILSYDGVLGLHDLMIHNYGSTQHFAVGHVEVSSSADIMLSHDIIDNIERDVFKELNIHLTLHMDPIEADNLQVLHLRGRVLRAISKLDDRLSIHDFRMVNGTLHTNLLFDVVVPYGVDYTMESITAALDEEFAADTENGDKKYYYVIEIDRQYV